MRDAFPWDQAPDIWSEIAFTPRPELYNLVSDRGEERNAFSEHRTVGAAMLDRLRAFDDRGGRASNRTPLVDRGVAQRISSLGYVGGTAGEIPSTSSDQMDPKDAIAAFNRMTRIQWQNAGRMPPRQPSCGEAPRP